MIGGRARTGEAFLQRLETAGYEFCDPSVLQPASVFVALSGEDLRGRLLMTSDGAGGDYCLRPEFTIPVSLAYLASSRAGSPAAFCCHGPVFRQRSAGSAEFAQAGLENFGRADREAADAEVLALALESAGAGKEWRTRIGDAGLLAAVLEKLSLPPVWMRRIRGGLAKGEEIGGILAPVDSRGDHAGVLAALESADKAGARALVEDLLNIAGISALGGRTAGEIAERFLEQAALRSRAALDDARRDLLQKFFAIESQPDQASAQLRALFAQTHIDLDTEMERFDQRLNFMAARGLDMDAMVFSASFARNLDYYSGFVFEASPNDAVHAEPVIGGGRYDRLLSTLGAKTDIPALGAAIFTERLNGAQ